MSPFSLQNYVEFWKIFSNCFLTTTCLHFLFSLSGTPLNQILDYLDSSWNLLFSVISILCHTAWLLKRFSQPHLLILCISSFLLSLKFLKNFYCCCFQIYVCTHRHTHRNTHKHTFLILFNAYSICLRIFWILIIIHVLFSRFASS